MSVAERNDSVPQDQPQGARAEQENFIAQTGGDLSPVQQPAQDVVEPIAIQPQALGAFQEPDLDEPDDEPGLDPEMFEALLGAGTSADAQDARALANWRPILEFIASQPGASQGMRNLAAALRGQ